MKANLITLIAAAGVDPNGIAGAHAKGRPPNLFHPQDRAAPPAVLKSKGLLQAGVQNIDAANVPCNPRSSCRMKIVDGDEELDVELEPHSVRGKGFKVLVQGDDGELTESTLGEANTYRGRVMGVEGSAVAASITAEGMLMEIFMPDGQTVVVEPAVDGLKGDHVVYHREDVEPTPEKMCGAMSLDENSLERRSLEEEAEAGEDEGHRYLRKHLDLHPFAGHEQDDHHHHHPRQLHGNTEQRKLQGGVRVAQLAIDADNDYYRDYGSVSAAISQIESIVNAINVQYERDVGIRHEISTIIVRLQWLSDPYTSTTDPEALLNVFRNHWNTNHQDIQRDVAHLFTGKEMDGGIIGIAWLGVVCQSVDFPSQGYGYGLSQSDFNGNFNSATDLTAHELGHNWNADHCNCPSHTMHRFSTSANVFNPTETIPAIATFRDSATCLVESCTVDTDCSTGGICEQNVCVQSITETGSPTTKYPTASPTKGPTVSPSGSPPVCGDGIIDAASETCDGSALNGQTCAYHGCLSGILACLSDCSDYDTSGCTECCHPRNCGGCKGKSKCEEVMCNWSQGSCTSPF